MHLGRILFLRAHIYNKNNATLTENGYNITFLSLTESRMLRQSYFSDLLRLYWFHIRTISLSWCLVIIKSDSISEL